MKPIHIGILIAAGALGGALVMKVVQRQPAPARAPVVATAPQQPAAAPIPLPVVEPAPSPFPEKEEVKAPVRKTRHSQPAEKQMARNEPPAPVGPAAPAPAAPAPADNPPPAPARTEPEPEQATPPPPLPPLRQVTLAAGTLLPVRLVDGLSSDRNQAGDTFMATLDQPLAVDGLVIAERGARLEGRVVESVTAGRVKGVSELAIELTRLHTSDGQNIRIQTDTFTKTGPKTVREDVERGAATTAIGAAIGAIAGGGKGAAIGAGVGAATGVGVALGTRGKPSTLPTETRLTLRLNAPVILTERPR